MPSSLLVRAVFGLLVIATLGAFFVTQRLKRSTPVVTRFVLERHISPNGDGRKDRVTVGFNLPEPDDVTLSVVNADGDEVRRLVDDQRLGEGRYRYVWDGRTDDGAIAPEGRYRLSVGLRRQGRSVVSGSRLRLDVTPPATTLQVLGPPEIAPGHRGARQRVRVRYSGFLNGRALFRVYRTDAGPPREVARFRTARFRREAEWDGRVRGRPAREGIYALAVTIRDRAGNAGSDPGVLPPVRGSTRPRTGVSVRYLSAAGPLEPVPAGRRVPVAVGPGAPRVAWRLVRLGARRGLGRGRGAGPRMLARVPHRARTGVHVLRVRARRRTVLVPLIVTARPARRGARAAPAAAARRPLLVVLPVLTWQGLNEVDDDADGFADTLDRSSSVRLARPLARGALPRGLVPQIAPLLRLLDRERVRFDLTSDLALARAGGRRLGGRPGILFPGSERWVTERLDLALREYVEGGGRVASFGVDAFRRRVTLAGSRLTEPRPPEPADAFGERTRRARSAPAPLAVTTDRAGLFAGTDGFVGLFRRLELSDGLLPGARLASAAGRDAERPAFVAYRLGRGLVVRAGTPEWSGQIAGSPEVARVTRRVFAALRRGTSR